MRMHKYISAKLMLVFLVLFGSLATDACATNASHPSPTQQLPASPTPPTQPHTVSVTLRSNAFTQTDITISAGQTVQFLDPTTTGGNHILCFGVNGQCDADAQGPELLHAPGLTLSPGDTKDVAFPNAGSYQVTCAIHPSMQLTISVLGVG